MEDANHNGVQDPGETHPCKIDSDDDGHSGWHRIGIMGIEDIGPNTDTSVFQPDLDPKTTTNPLKSDTDGDGISDGEEDLNHNGKFDSGETEPAVNDAYIIYIEQGGTCANKSPCYTTIQGAISGAGDGFALRIAKGTYDESYVLDEPKTLTLQGGWDSTFTNQTSNATIIKAPRGSKGSLTLQMVTIKP